jgi:hypothetical protein
MARPKRTVIDEMCDRFADLPVESQDGLLLTLSAIHRQARRAAAKRNGKEEPEQSLVLEESDGD